MKAIYEKPKMNVLKIMTEDIVTASVPIKVSDGKAQQQEEPGVSWDSMW